jgi:GTP-binding protein EngB required for normal cell division
MAIRIACRRTIQMPESRCAAHEAALNAQEKSAISLAKQLIRSYHLADLQPTLDAAERLTSHRFLNVAVFGRFKAGKSSFLNNLLDRPVLPVGVVPVTSVVTEICHGPRESAQVIYQKRAEFEVVPISEIGTYISEPRNPRNVLGVERVRVFLPEMAPYKGLRLIDTPGLESSLIHNTETSLAWSPNTDLALVAIGVDPPLTQQDVALIARLRRFTPNVSILLTKMDLLNSSEQQEILEFVLSQLRTSFSADVRVFPYSVKPGYEEMRDRGVKPWLLEFTESHQEAHSAALARKLHTLLTSAGDYLQLSLKSAEAKETDRQLLCSKVLGDGQSSADLNLHVRLIAARAVARTRPLIESHLRKYVHSQLQKTLEERLAAALPNWPGSLGKTLGQFRQWLAGEMSEELAVASARESAAFLAPWLDAQRLSQSVIQSFRDKLSEEVLRVFGLALRTTETEIDIKPPSAPDVSISKVFNHDWELIFALVPMSLVRSMVERQLMERVEGEVFKNLSRLTSQWEEIVCGAIQSTEQEAHRRIEELVTTVRRLLSSDDAGQADAIRGHLRQLQVEIDRLGTRKEPA